MRKTIATRQRTGEEALSLITGHRILPEALIGYRLSRDIYDRFPRQGWVKILSDDAGEPFT